MFAVCGGKWSEGLNYRGEMLSGAMVIGLPLAPFNRVRKMVIEYFRHKSGGRASSSATRCRRSIGRSRRSAGCYAPGGRGVLVLGKHRFLEKRVQTALPVWMQEEIIECDARSSGR